VHIVAKRGDSVYLRFLLQPAPTPICKTTDGNSPMMIAANAGTSRASRVLLTYKANVNLRNAKGGNSADPRGPASQP